ncbi:UNVERIFIED_CONTAM: U3 small nucleolar ribonucleoprotein IMP4 [Sesamum radiatum]|uniref:U3 small nucleolar ribonucleoprotein IMP4 n=1 Tax=Sesamum radiatum TaxID=300843 RepID=A0AAW2RC90_SESRA
MLKRNVRLRREYLYRKSLEGKERLLYEKKRKIREALEEGKPIPTELRNEEAALRQEIDLEDEHTAGIEVCISKCPTNESWWSAFVISLNCRCSYHMTGWGMINCDLSGKRVFYWMNDKPLYRFHANVKRDVLIMCRSQDMISRKKAIGTMPEAYPHLILDNFSTKLGQRTANILKYLFPVPKPDTKRIITFANQSDYISFRHHLYEKRGGPKSIELKEIGPRFELRLYQIKLGTMDQDEAQTEWVIRPYMNTARKRKFLGE